jgi:phytoene dehydrogenase-like protein
MSQKITIIGGGIAGLSAGIYALKNGFEAEIIEMHTVPGGQCTAWRKKGHLFDYCIHWLVGSSSGPFHQIYNETGALNNTVKILNNEIYASYVNSEGELMHIYNDLDQWVEYLSQMAPDDRAALLRMKKEMRAMGTLESFEDAPGCRPVKSYLRAVFKSMPAFRLFIKYGKLNAKQYVESLNLKSDKVRNFLIDTFGIEEFGAIVFLMMLSWFDQKNAGYPIGGSLPFSLRMADTFRSLGGTLSLGHKVEEIIVENSKAVGVKLSDGSIKKSDFIVGACDLHNLIEKQLGGRYTSPEITEAFSNWPLFNPIVFISVGLSSRLDLHSHTVSYRCPGKMIGSTALRPGYMIRHFNHDPLITPEGKTTLTIMFESPWELWEELEGDAYRAEKERIEADMRAELEKHFPGISASIEVFDIATPKTTVRYTGVHHGAYEGWKPTTEILRKSIKMQLPGLENFYLAGQWLYPGGGIPPAIQSGRWVIQLIRKSQRKPFITA